MKRTLIYRSKAILYKIPASCFVANIHKQLFKDSKIYMVRWSWWIHKQILKFIWRGKKPRLVKSVLKEKNKIGGPTLPELKNYYKATLFKTVQYWGKDREIDQWDRVESPEMDPHKYSQLIFDKGAKAV